MLDNIYDRVNDYSRVHISLASPNDIRSWSFGEVKKPDHAGLQKQLGRLVETHVKPVLSDLSYTIEQGTIRVRGDYRKGLYRKTEEERRPHE